jgi:hypothetical protein
MSVSTLAIDTASPYILWRQQVRRRLSLILKRPKRYVAFDEYPLVQ